MKKKGFTLIELLAVIVILAVIALITVPMIMGIIEKAKKNAFKDSVLNAFGQVEYYLIQNNLTKFPEEGIEVKKLKLKNNTFEYGLILKNDAGKLVAENVSDGRYCARGEMKKLEVFKGECDVSAPSGEAVVEGKKATITLKDDQGVIGYEITKNETVENWTTIELTKETTIEWTAAEAGTYYVHIKDKYGKINRISFVIEQSAFCAYQPGDIVGIFTTPGKVEDFLVPCSGTYKLEVWGAQGGNGFNGNGTGGKGGYSYGNKDLVSKSLLYVVVGGKGSNCSGTGGISSGGYNGGAKTGPAVGDCGGGAGGGATHIATTNRGVLSNYVTYQPDVIIVAGGGGGGFYHTSGKVGLGGAGGGISGGTGSNGLYGNGIGGTQSSGSSFGTGGTNSSNAAAGGGAGWYGGTSGGQASTGGGGSGYLNASELISGTTGMSNGVQSGDGKVVITFVSLSE